jgi:hypothetical protein
MFLQVHEIPRDELKHLYCTDPALNAEFEAVNRSLHRLDEGIAIWTHLDPNVALEQKEVGRSSFSSTPWSNLTEYRSEIGVVASTFSNAKNAPISTQGCHHVQ